MTRDRYCTVVGYRFDHEDNLCKDCAQTLRVEEGIHEKRFRPIFDESTFDEQPVCAEDDCETEIPATVVDEGAAS